MRAAANKTNEYNTIWMVTQTIRKLYLARLFDFGLDTNENSQVLHHLSQLTRICLPIFTHVKHQTHRQTVLDVYRKRYHTANSSA